MSESYQPKIQSGDHSKLSDSTQTFGQEDFEAADIRAVPVEEYRRRGEAFNLQELYVLLVEEERELGGFRSNNKILQQVKTALIQNPEAVRTYQDKIIMEARERSADLNAYVDEIMNPNQLLEDDLYNDFDAVINANEASRRHVIEYATKDYKIRQALADRGFASRFGNTHRPDGRQIDEYYEEVMINYNEYLENSTTIQRISGIIGGLDRLKLILEKSGVEPIKFMNIQEFSLDRQARLHEIALVTYEKIQTAERRRTAQANSEYAYQVIADNAGTELETRLTDAKEIEAETVRQAIATAAKTRAISEKEARSKHKNDIKRAHQAKKDTFSDERAKEQADLIAFDNQHSAVRVWRHHQAEGIEILESFSEGVEDNNDPWSALGAGRASVERRTYKDWANKLSTKSASETDTQEPKSESTNEDTANSSTFERSILPRLPGRKAKKNRAESIETKKDWAEIQTTAEMLFIVRKFATIELILKECKDTGLEAIHDGIIAKDKRERVVPFRIALDHLISRKPYLEIFLSGTTEEPLFKEALERWGNRDDRGRMKDFARDPEAVEHYKNFCQIDACIQWFHEHGLKTPAEIEADQTQQGNRG